MAKTATAGAQLRKGDKVVAATDLRDVPEGTEGKVTMVTGLTWIRYWVRFANDVSLGSISRDKLSTAADRQFIANGGVVASSGDDDGGSGDDGGGEDDGGGGVTTPAGTFIPQKFIERAAEARGRLSAA